MGAAVFFVTLRTIRPDLPPFAVPSVTRKSGVARLIDLGGGGGV